MKTSSIGTCSERHEEAVLAGSETWKGAGKEDKLGARVHRFLR